MSIPSFLIFSTLSVSMLISFLVHQWGEQYFTRRGTRPIKLVIRGYQVHHSFFGALAILLAPILASGLIVVAALGYGIGNIWQHKKTHNSVNERGFIFISRVI